MVYRGFHCLFPGPCLSLCFLHLSGVLLWQLIYMLRLVVSYNLIYGFAVWLVSPYEIRDSSLHMVLTPYRRCCGEFVANEYAFKKANSS